MSDPRNIAHDKKVSQEKEHDRAKDAADEKQPAAPEVATAPQDENAVKEHEQSVAVLSKLKEMEFHSRANIEVLAGLTLTIGDELKQKEFVDPIGDLYGAQDAFQTRISELVTSYEAKCETLKPTA